MMGIFGPAASSLSHRISRGEFAAAYFGLDPQEATWGRSDLDSLLQAQAPRDALGQLVSKTQSSILPERDKVRLRGQLLDALEEGFEAGNPSLTSDWFRAVLDVSPIFIRAVDVKPSGFLYHVTNEERLRWLLVRPMQGMSPDQRAGLIRPNISDLADISLLCVVFRSMAGDLTADGVTPPYGENVFGSETEALRAQLVSRVREIAAKGKFWSQALPGAILWFWRGSDHESEVKEFTSLSMGVRGILAKVLEVPVSEVYSTAGNYYQVGSAWSDVIDLGALDEIAFTLKRSVSEEDRKSAERYLDARRNARERPF